MNEDSFIRALQNKERTAYSQLLDNYQDLVYGTCLSFVPNREDAEDIAQEVFVEVFRSVHSFKGNSKLSTWIYKISVSKCLQFIRKKNAKKRFVFLESLSGRETPIDRTWFYTNFDHPGVLLENKETSETLFKAVDKLPDDQRTAFTLVKIDGLSYQETSEIMKKSVSSIESLLFRARKNLKKYLSEFYKK